jgi:1-deoxy-D-xylulose-5-phosphate reductoisomerase
VSVPTPNPILSSNAKTRRVLVLGSTGSIGVQTLEVIEHLNGLFERGESSMRYQIVGLAGGLNTELLASQAARFAVRDVAICKGNESLDQSGLNLYAGADSARRLVEEVPCDLVVGAIVGFAGLDSVLSAIERGIDVALANKETLVAAGSLVIESARKSGARLLPVDSEHAGIWQCLQSIAPQCYWPPMDAPSGLERVVLTASGGSFRERTRDQLNAVTLDEALTHPNWTMGAKVTIDSATLMNKALELIEAHWLFGLDAEQLGAVIHPQSIVHALIECTDASVIAQMGAPDMKAPIQHAVSFPDRVLGCAERLDVTKLARLDFQEIDQDRFPAIGLAMRVIEAGGTTGAILNAANEQAVGAFVEGRLGFERIDECVALAMNELPIEPINTIDDVIAADTRAREFVDGLCAPSAGGVR